MASLDGGVQQRPPEAVARGQSAGDDRRLFQPPARQKGLCGRQRVGYTRVVMDTPQAVPSLALAAYSEDLITGRRVVLFGNALSGLAETLVERGARLVHVYDDNPARVAEAAARSSSTSVSFAPLTPGGMAARDGAFDVGFVDEIATFADPAQLVTKLRRALSARGVGFVCTANPDVSPLFASAGNAPQQGPASKTTTLSYYELYDLVSTQFDEVRMIGQTPFVGYALADFSPDTESEFSIDTGFVPGGAEEPERYLAVCSHFPVSVEPFCVVQMLASALLEREEAAPVVTPALKLEAEARSNAELAELRRELASERAEKAKLEQLFRDVNDELKRRDEWVQQLESRAATADERADSAQAALERHVAKQRSRAEEVRQPPKEAPPSVELTQQLNQRTRELREQERRVEDLAQKLAEGEQRLSSNGQRVVELQRQVAELQVQLAHAEKAQRVAEEAHVAAQSRLDVLTLELADSRQTQHEVAELQTTIAELRAQLGAMRSDLHLAGDEIAGAEQQLIDQGALVSSLRADLAETERFAALLLAERYGDPRAVEASAPAAEEHQVSRAVDVPSERPLGTEAPENEPPAATDFASDTHTVATPPAPDAATEQARARETELQAALQATRWTVEELENRLAERGNEPELLERLYLAECQLQRQATLIEQYERSARSASSTDGPSV